MKLGKGSPPIWPGYVAAMASLLLSLLLLLAVLVFAMSQVGAIVDRYEQEILRAIQRDDQARKEAAEAALRAQALLAQAAKRQASSEAEAKRALSLPGLPLLTPPPVPRELAPPPPPPAPRSAQPVYLRLVFESGVGDLLPHQAAEITAAVKQLRLPGETVLRLEAQVPDKDQQYQRSAYRLLLQVRALLVEQGIPQGRIAIQLRPSGSSPPGYERGEIAVNLSHSAGASGQEGSR